MEVIIKKLLSNTYFGFAIREKKITFFNRISNTQESYSCDISPSDFNVKNSTEAFIKIAKVLGIENLLAGFTVEQFTCAEFSLREEYIIITAIGGTDIFTLETRSDVVREKPLRYRNDFVTIYT